MSCTASSVVFAVGAMIRQILVDKIGTIELATYCILVPFFYLMYALYYGLSVASSVTIGGLLGKKDFTGAKATAKSFLKWIGVLGVYRQLGGHSLSTKNEHTRQLRGHSF